MPVLPVGFDLFETLVEVEADVNECILSMCRHLDSHGFSFADDYFLESYRASVLWYRTIRNEGLREMNNAYGCARFSRACIHSIIYICNVESSLGGCECG